MTRRWLRRWQGGDICRAVYIDDDAPLFAETTRVDARYNRAVIYRSALLHSGAISVGARLDPDPATGRLTITAFLATA